MKAKHLLIVCWLCSSVAIAFTACNQKPATDNQAENVQTPEAEAVTAEDQSAASSEKYIDIELPTPHGDLIRVSDYVPKNKYTLIDFWASWCGPCRAEMPTVVKAYTDYHAKGLEVIGVSLDNNRDAWIKAIELLNMPWPQMSDLQGWNCAGAQLYNIRSIPANVLVDQQGNVVAKNLRGEDLLNKMAELLNAE